MNRQAVCAAMIVLTLSMAALVASRERLPQMERLQRDSFQSQNPKAEEAIQFAELGRMRRLSSPVDPIG